MSTSSSPINNAWKCPFLHIFPAQDFQSNLCQTKRFKKKKKLTLFHLTVFSSREGNGTPLQYTCLENPMGGGAWQATVRGVTRSQTRLRDFTFTFHFHALEKEMATHSSVLAWNPRDGGAWWAAVYAVTQSRTRLKRLSSSSWRSWELCRAFHVFLYVFLLWFACFSNVLLVFLMIKNILSMF